jgi:hypothetical protein
MPYAPLEGLCAYTFQPDSRSQSATRQLNSSAPHPRAVTISRAIACAEPGSGTPAAGATEATFTGSGSVTV